jgi:hypothetical protein
VSSADVTAAFDPLIDSLVTLVVRCLVVPGVSLVTSIGAVALVGLVTRILVTFVAAVTLVALGLIIPVVTIAMVVSVPPWVASVLVTGRSITCC